MSRSDRFDRGDFETRYGEAAPMQPGPVAPPLIAQTERAARGAIWPIAQAQLQRVGESVLADRDGKGRPHKGLDLFADAGTTVLSATDGEVLRVVDGRKGDNKAQRRAGLFVDVRGADARVYRYLHMGDARVERGQHVAQGTPLGTVAAPYTSGLRAAPHLHFEIREGDFDSSRQDYGRPVDPRRVLPPLRA